MARVEGFGEAGRLGRGIGLLGVLVVAGCGQPRYPNAPVQCEGRPAAECRSAYSFESLALGPANTDELFVCLTFSGGGTRAAALAYGVLQELAETPIPPLANGLPRTMLDEVDMVSSVSGGSFTALAYKLWGKDLFGGPFAERFLYHNVMLDLVTRIIVRNLFVLPVIFPDRIHIAADYVNEEIFDHCTYAALRSQRPYVVVNATSMSGYRFEFTQDDFDLLGSDLSSVPLGHAAMASSAYPLLLSPMRLRYYENELSGWALEQALALPDEGLRLRRQQWARKIVDPDAKECTLDIEQHRFVYLLDGGIQDNLGLEYVLEAYRHGPIRRRLDGGGPGERIRRLVVIAVNADTELEDGIEERRIAPGLLEMGSRAAAIGVSSNSATKLELTRCMLNSCAGHDGCACYLVEVSLKDVGDAERRQTLAICRPRYI